MKVEATKKEPIPAYMTVLAKELIERNLVLGTLDELIIFKSIIIAAKVDDIRSYSNSFEDLRKQWFDYIHLKLNEYGFVNGEPKDNTWDKRPKAAFWWEIYKNDAHYYRPYHDHHCSSRNLQEQMLNYVEDLIQCIIETNKGGTV